MSPSPDQPAPSQAEALETLEGLAALLAERDDVGGVECRDPDAIAEGPDFEAPEVPELVVYTTPVNHEAVLSAIAALATTLGARTSTALEHHAGDDWRDVWKRHYRSLRFRSDTAALMIRPSWIPREDGDPELEVIIDPGRAFGTGLHESTRLCLQLLVDLGGFVDQAPARLADLGCGSGILSLAALRLFPGLASVVLVDLDPEAVETSAENLTMNGFALGEPESGPRITAVAMDLLATGAFPGAPVDLLLANIRPSVLGPAAPTLIAGLAPGGTLVLSGILDEEVDALLPAYAGAVEELARRSEGGWTALALRRAGDP
nr:50S ribosomal protein L11 methyltransferase [Pseudenhygromyxa sp. WMMC2535]